MPGPAASLGRLLLGAGLVLAGVGGLLLLADRFPWLRLGRLPGDVSIERDGFRIYAPIGTSILVSAVVSLVLWLASRR